MINVSLQYHAMILAFYFHLLKGHKSIFVLYYVTLNIIFPSSATYKPSLIKP